MGDFNAHLLNNFVDSFCGSYNLKSLTKKPKCFKNPDHPTCIDLILTNRQKRFQNSTNIEIGLCDFHNPTVTVFKSYLKKRKPKELTYRDFKNSNQQFRTELVRNNQSSFITKEVRKTIMTRSRLRNKFLKTKSQECKQAYNKQRNLCVKKVRIAKKNYFNNLNVRNITDNKQFWNTGKPFFSSKVGDNER